jgi:hypothetical protein
MVAESTRSVADGFELLCLALAESPVPDPLVVERLERAAKRQLDELGPTAEGFEADTDLQLPTIEGQSGGAASDEAILAEVLAYLATGNALLAAGQAVGETGTAGKGQEFGRTEEAGLGDTETPLYADRLEEAGGLLTSVADGLEQRVRRRQVQQSGFEPVPPSEDLPSAVARLTDQVGATLEDLASASGDVATEALSKAFEWAPDHVTEAINNLGNKLKLGERGQRLVLLALKAIDKALSALHLLIPLDGLGEMRDELIELRGRFDTGEPAPAVLGWLIGVEDVKAEASRLARSSSSISAIDAAVDKLRALAERFASLMKLVSGIIAALGMVTGLVTILGVAVPHLPVVAAGAFMLVIAAVVLIGSDYTDARSVPNYVTGVRSIVRTAWETHEPTIHR